MNKTVLITGASRGIGRATAVRFARAGYRVAACYHRSERDMRQLCSELTQDGFAIQPYQADVADAAQVERMVQAVLFDFGGIDVLVNNAGIAQQKLFTDITEDDWRRMLGVHVDGTFYCCKAVLPPMIRQKSGRIINVSSIWGITGASCEVHYSTAKAAVIGLTKALAKEVGPSNITVNCVAPGIVDTQMNAALSEEDRRQLAYDTPLERFGTPEDIAESILFLESDAASFITGQVLSPNGGYVI